MHCVIPIHPKRIMRLRSTVSIVVKWFSVSMFAMSFSGEHRAFIVEYYFSSHLSETPATEDPGVRNTKMWY